MLQCSNFAPRFYKKRTISAAQALDPCYVGAQKNSNLWLMFCVIIESNSPKPFFSIVLCTNMAAAGRKVKIIYMIKIHQY